MSSKLKKLQNQLKESSIYIGDFLINYYGVYNKDITTKGITHKAIKILMPELKRAGFEDLLDNMHDLYTGNVVPVRDSKGEVLPYINPKIDELEYLDIADEEFDDDVSFEVTSRDQKFEQVIIGTDMTLYELVCLYKELKKQGRTKDCRQIQRRIKDLKPQKSKKYIKEKNNMRGFDEYAKY